MTQLPNKNAEFLSVRDCVKLLNSGTITAEALAKHFGKGTSYFHSHRLKKVGFTAKKNGKKPAYWSWGRTGAEAPWDMNILASDFVKQFNNREKKNVN